MPGRRLGEFIQALRHAGLRISPAEAADAMEAVALVGYRPSQHFYQALESTLVKQAGDQPVFAQTFACFFHGESEQAELTAETSPATESPLPEPLKETSLPSLVQLNVMGLEQQLAQTAAQMDFTAMEAITQQGLYSQRLLMNMGMGAVDDQILTLIEGTPAQQARARQMRQWRRQVRARAASLVRRQYQLHGAGKGRALREQALRDVPFRQLREYHQVRHLVQRLARRLASLHQRRVRRSRRGLLDARRTLASSVRHDGVPAQLHWRQRPRQKSRVVVICDVSGSVREAARFLLQFLYAMTDTLPQVRSFAFAAEFGEITSEFADLAPDQAVAQVLARWSGSGTDYGHMLETFWTQYGTQLDRHTTVIILGDARNNHLPDGAAYLEKVSRRVKQVWWLNPQASGQWNSGDAVMSRYQPHCRQARQCATLNDLERAVDGILKSLQR